MAPEGRNEPTLEAMLAELGPSLDLPTTPDISGRVVRELRAPQRRRLSWIRIPSRRRPLVLVTAVAVALGIAVIGVVPEARRAVADWLGLPGVRIEARDRPPADELGGHLNLGRAVSLTQARDEVGFDVRVPDRLGPPDETHLAPEPRGGRVTLLYRTGAGLPAIEGTDVGLLLTECGATLDEELIRKNITAGNTVRRVGVNSEEGFWIGGAPHVVFFLGPEGFPIDETMRLADRTLVWEDEDVILRIESGLNLHDTLRIARSVR